MSQKEKFLSSAQKFILKGQIDRAIKDYEQVVALDPQDIRHRQKLADLLVRANRKDDAVREYLTIGNFYADNAFYLKAIAVFKQIQKIDPQNVDLVVRLAELNEKQGLKGNALAEYKSAVDYYEKSGNAAEAGKILDRMLAVDPSNATIRLKKAEVFLSAKMGEKAYQEYLQAAILFEQKRDTEGFNRLAARVRTLFPDRQSFVIDLAEEHIRTGDPSTARRQIESLLRSEPRNRKAWALLAEAYAALSNSEGTEKTLRKMVQLFPEDLDARGALLDFLLDSDRFDEGLRVVQELHSKAAPAAVVERWYKSLLEKSPGDLRVLEGLRGVYAEKGEKRKLADVEARIEILSRTRTAPERPVQQAAPVPQPPPFDDGGWEEEIDLSLEDDDFLSDFQAGVEEIREEEAVQDVAAHLEPAPEEVPEAEAAAEIASPEETPVLPDVDDLYEPLVEIPDQALPEIVLDFDTPGTPPVTIGDDDYDFPPVELDTVSAPEVTDDLLPLSAEEGWEELEEASFEEAFTEAQGGSCEEAEDTESHFNLGIAYREMGLYGEAIREFEKASHDPNRRLSSITLQGMCYREKGDAARAEETFLGGLATAPLAPEEEASLAYELGLLLEQAERLDEAAEMYRRAERSVPGFRDSVARIRALKGDEEVLPELDLEEAELEPLE